MLNQQSFLNRSLTLVALISIISAIFVMNIARFIYLDQSPPGFHVDELASAVTIQCMATEGVDIFGTKYPLWGFTGYGNPKPPTFIYPGILWTKVFGFSFASFRSFLGFVTLLTLVALFFLAKRIFDYKYAFFVVLAGSLSPWAFQFSRINIACALFPLFMVWGMYFFLKSHKWYDGFFAGLMMSLAMYSYPTARLQVPLLIITLIFFKKLYHGLTFKHFILFSLTLFIVSIPLIQGILSGELMTRFQDLSIFSEKYLQSIGKTKTFWNVLFVFCKNFFLHFNPDYLFFRGDKNMVYSTRVFGQCSWVDIFAFFLALIGLLWIGIKKIIKPNNDKKNNLHAYLVVFLMFNMFIAVIPSALTWQDIPHSARTLSTWPFLSLLIGFVLYQMIPRLKYSICILAIISVVFTVNYLKHYFLVYPKKSYWMFSSHIKDLALNAKTEQDWQFFILQNKMQNFHIRYYLMNYVDGQTCGSTLEGWKKLRKAWEMQGKKGK